MERFTTRCNKCKQLITFIRTDKGTNMPCDPTPVRYIENANGRHKVYTGAGKCVRCELGCGDTWFTGWGFVPHWGSCISGEGKKRITALSEKRPSISAPPPAAPIAKPLQADEPKFEQLCLFGGERRSRHPVF